MNREQLLARLDQRWQAFARSLEGLSEADMIEPGVVGDWSVKDILGHVASWEAEALKALPLLVQGRRPPRYGGIDGFNERQWQARRGHSLEEASAELQATHSRLLAYLERVPEEFIEGETRFRHRLRLDTYSHYPEHTQAILAWRQARGL